jgi:hypothetical protein
MQQYSSDNQSDKNLKKIIGLCYEMLELADHGDKLRTDDGCGVVYGMLRDAAYKVRRLAENEISLHEQIKKTSLR